MVSPAATDVLSDLPTYRTIVRSLRSDHSSAFNRAVLDPARSLVTAVAGCVDATVVGEPHANGLAGMVGATGVWMATERGQVWHILLHDHGSCQDEWTEQGQRMVRARRAPWRLMPGHQRVVEALGVQRSLVLESVLPQGPDGSFEDLIAERAGRDEAWAGEDLIGLLALWTSARMWEGHSAATARLMLALRLPASALSNAVVARWRAGEVDGDLSDLTLLGLA